LSQSKVSLALNKLKNFFKKLAAAIVLSVILSISLSTNMSFAADETPVNETSAKLNTNLGDKTEQALIFANDKLCLDLTDPKESSKVIVVLEEPIFQPSGSEIPGDEGCYSQKGNPEFKVCTCYRNSYTYTQKAGTEFSKVRTDSEILKECSKTAKAEYEKNQSSDSKTRFACQEVQVLFCNGGTCLLNSYIGMIYRWAATIVGLISVIVIIISAIQLSLAGGDQSAVDSAKTRILQSIGGLAVLFLSAVILNAINPNFFILG
jgi:hypothetical protein